MTKRKYYFLSGHAWLNPEAEDPLTGMTIYLNNESKNLHLFALCQERRGKGDEEAGEVEVEKIIIFFQILCDYPWPYCLNTTLNNVWILPGDKRAAMASYGDLYCYFEFKRVGDNVIIIFNLKRKC